MALAWFAGARNGIDSPVWRIEQDADGSVVIITDGDAPGLCISPEDGGYSLLAWEGSGEYSRSGPYGSFDSALRAALRVLRQHHPAEQTARGGHA